jgi:hypothetical protein
MDFVWGIVVQRSDLMRVPMRDRLLNKYDDVVHGTPPASRQLGPYLDNVHGAA